MSEKSKIPSKIFIKDPGIIKIEWINNISYSLCSGAYSRTALINDLYSHIAKHVKEFEHIEELDELGIQELYEWAASLKNLQEILESVIKRYYIKEIDSELQIQRLFEHYLLNPDKATPPPPNSLTDEQKAIEDFLLHEWKERKRRERKEAEERRRQRDNDDWT